MKFYFCASARGLKQYSDYYKKICHIAEQQGNQNLDDLAVTVDPQEFYQDSRTKQQEHYERTIHNIKAADIVILEVSTHSLSMGFIMQKALELSKPVIALYHTNNSPFFAAGIENDKLQVIEYNDSNLERVLSDALEYAKDQADIRFNFFISPKISTFLDWISKEKRIPRSVYLRRLIENDMKDNKEYQEAA